MKWEVVEIDARSLYYPPAMADCLKKPYNLSRHWSVRAGINVISAEFSGERVDIVKVASLLGKHASKKGLLLILDEAQRLSTLTGGPHDTASVDTLDAIHNGKLGRPVILLAGGLGSSQAAFGSLGISRFADDCIVDLGRLDHASERAVIRDWLVKDGGAKGDVTPWIDAIAAETHGWPQHIMTYAQPAAWWLRQDGGELTDAGLTYTLKRGRTSKTKYYQNRVGM